MNQRNRNLLLATLAGFALALPACGAAEGCEDFANHLADVASKESPTQVDDETRAKMVKKTLDSCNAAPPKKEALDCALKAQTIKDMKACEGGADEEKKEESKADAKADGKEAEG